MFLDKGQIITTFGSLTSDLMKPMYETADCYCRKQLYYLNFQATLENTLQNDTLKALINMGTTGDKYTPVIVHSVENLHAF